MNEYSIVTMWLFLFTPRCHVVRQRGVNRNKTKSGNQL